jgi:copper resistance protein B
MSRRLLSMLGGLLLVCAAAAAGQDTPPDADHQHQEAGTPAVTAPHTHPPHAAEEQSDADASRPPAAPLPPFVPAVTDADRAAAFPEVGAHALGDNAIRAYVLLDQFEWHQQDQAIGWNARGWVGRDRDRFWFRSEGERGLGSVESISVQGLYGRAFTRWWDVVMGIRQDMEPGPAQTWAAIGLQRSSAAAGGRTRASTWSTTCCSPTG